MSTNGATAVVALVLLLPAWAQTTLRGSATASGPAPSMMDIYASQDPLAGKPATMPPALQGRVRRCVPPVAGWILVYETERMCYYFAPFPQRIKGIVLTIEEAQQRRRDGSNARCGMHPWDPSKLVCDDDGNYAPVRDPIRTPTSGSGPCYIPPTLPADVQAEMRKHLLRECYPNNTPPSTGPIYDPRRRDTGIGTNPPVHKEKDDPSFTDGIKAGFQDCSKPFATMWRAFQALQRGDYVGAAKTLGAENSAAGIYFVADSLKALWQDIAATQVLDTQGQKVSDYEKGRRQALRICTWALIPAATECAAASTACVARAAKRATPATCVQVVEQIQKANPFKPKSPLPKPLSPWRRGMLLEDEKLFQQLAISQQKTFIIRDSNPAALRWAGQPGFRPKPMEIKGKTLKREELPASQVINYEGLASARGLSTAERAELVRKGYRIGSPREFEIIRDSNGNAFYSDIDLHGVYNLDGSSGWTAELDQELKCGLLDRGVQHPPHDIWLDRNNPVRAGPNYGPQVGNGRSLTAVLPDGRMVQVSTLEQMKQLYKAIGADFKSIYPDF